MTAPSLQPYVELASTFLGNRISAEEYETLFLDLRRRDIAADVRPREQWEAIGLLFDAVERYVADPELRTDPKLDIDEGQLRQLTAEGLEKLRAFESRRYQ